MNTAFCNVALPVPLRTTFTYAVPEAARGTLQPGSRVLVPFRKKAMVGVVVELVEVAPEGTKVREIARVVEAVPGELPSRLGQKCCVHADQPAWRPAKGRLG